MTNRKLPDDESIRRLYVDCGLSERAIAEKYSVKRGTVVGRMRRAGIVPRPNRKSPPDDILMEMLSDRTKPIKLLMKELNLSRSTIGYHMDRLGLRRREVHTGFFDDEKLKELYLEKKLCAREIGEVLNRSPGTIAKHIERLGIARGSSGAQFNYTNRNAKMPTYNGYILVRDSTNPRSREDGYVFAHVLVAERTIGRQLRKEEVIHHIDFVKGNNSLRNLHIFASSSAHQRAHRSLEAVAIQLLHKGEIGFKDGLYCLKGKGPPKIDNMRTSKPSVFSLETWAKKTEPDSQRESQSSISGEK